MTPESLNTVLLSYCNLDAPKYAVMVNGPWDQERRILLITFAKTKTLNH